MLDLEESGVFLGEHFGAFFRNCHDEMFSFLPPFRALWLCSNILFSLLSPRFVVVSEYSLFSVVVFEYPPCMRDCPWQQRTQKNGGSGCLLVCPVSVVASSKKGLRFCCRHDKGLCPSSKAGRGGYCVLLESKRATGPLTLNGSETYCVSLSGAQATGSLTGRGPETYCVLLESQQATGSSTLNGPEPYCVLLSGAQATGF